jgi:hypothetical protein
MWNISEHIITMLRGSAILLIVLIVDKRSHNFCLHESYYRRDKTLAPVVTAVMFVERTGTCALCYPCGSRTRNNKIMRLLASTDTMRSDMAYYHYAQKFQ